MRWGSARRNPDLIHLLIPKKGLSSGGFYSRRTRVKEDRGWGPGYCRPRGEAGLSCPSESPSPQHPSRSACPLSPSTSTDHRGGPQNRIVASRLLGSLSQSSAQMPRGMEAWAGQCTGPSGEPPVGRRGSHRLCVQPAGSHICYKHNRHTGVGGGVEGTAQRLSPKQECHGRAEWKERPEF